MTREMQALVKRAKEQAAVLVRYANPRSKSKPTLDQVKNILSRHIPYCDGVVPAIVSCEVSEFHRNSIIRSAYFIVAVENGKKCEDENSEPFTSLVCSNGANDYVRSGRGRRIHIYVFSPEQRAAFTDFIASERLSRRFKEGIL